VRDKQVVSAHFAVNVYKFLLGLPTSLDDIKQMDEGLHKSLMWMQDNSIEGIIFETFEVLENQFGKMKAIELKPGGSHIDVTDENKGEFVQLMADWRLTNSILPQLSCLRDSLYTLIEPSYLTVFDPQELELILNGRHDVKVFDISLHAQFTGGYDASSQPVTFLWEALEEMTGEERGEVLKFCTGTARIPLDGFQPKFTVTKSEHDAEALPHAHTCFNQLVLPPYTSADQTKERLLYACRNSEGFAMT